MNCPVFGYLEKGVRQLVNLQITMSGVNKRSGLSFGRPLMLQTNSMSGKTYNKTYSPTYNGKTVRINSISFKKPDMEVIEQYEKMKRQFTNKMNKDILDNLKPKEKKEPNGKIPIDIEELVVLRDKGISQRMMAKMFDLSERTIARRMADAKRQEIEAKSLGKSGFRAMPPILTPL